MKTSLRKLKRFRPLIIVLCAMLCIAQRRKIALDSWRELYRIKMLNTFSTLRNQMNITFNVVLIACLSWESLVQFQVFLTLFYVRLLLISRLLDFSRLGSVIISKIYWRLDGTGAETIKETTRTKSCYIMPSKSYNRAQNKVALLEKASIYVFG